MEDRDTPLTRAFGYFVLAVTILGPGAFMWWWTESFAAGVATAIVIAVLIAVSEWAS